MEDSFAGKLEKKLTSNNLNGKINGKGSSVLKGLKKGKSLKASDKAKENEMFARSLFKGVNFGGLPKNNITDLRLMQPEESSSIIEGTVSLKEGSSFFEYEEDFLKSKRGGLRDIVR